MSSLLLKCLPCTRAKREYSPSPQCRTAKTLNDEDLLSRKQSIHLQRTPDVARARGFELVVTETMDADTQGENKTK